MQVKSLIFFNFFRVLPGFFISEPDVSGGSDAAIASAGSRAAVVSVTSDATIAFAESDAKISLAESNVHFFVFPRFTQRPCNLIKHLPRVRIRFHCV